jgi:hypothetical protein
MKLFYRNALLPLLGLFSLLFAAFRFTETGAADSIGKNTTDLLALAVLFLAMFGLRRYAHAMFSALFRVRLSLPVCALLCTLAVSQTASAQNASIEQSRYIGGSGADLAVGSQTVGANTYVWGTTTSAGLPVTNGSSFSGGIDYYITKYNAAGTMLFGSYFGGSGDETFGNYLFEIVGDDIYFAGRSASANLPVTNGSVRNGPSELFVCKMNTLSGTIAFCSYYGATGGGGGLDEYPYVMRVSGGDVYLASWVPSDYPVTTGATYMGGNFDFGVTKFDGSTGNAIWSTVFGGDLAEQPLANMHVEGGTVYIAGYTRFSSTTFTATTDGTIFNPSGNGDVFYAKFDAATGSKTFLTLYGANSSDAVSDMQVSNGEAYIIGATTPIISGIFPTTDGSTKKGNFASSDLFAMKYNAAGTVAYATIIGGASDEGFGSGTIRSFVKNGELFFAGRTSSSAYPTTNGGYHTGSTSGGNAWDIAVTKLSTTGAIVFSTQIGDTNGDNVLSINLGCNDELYVLGNISGGGGMPVTAGTAFTAGSALFKWNMATGQLLFSSYITFGLAGGANFTGTATPISLEFLSNGVVQLSGHTANTNYAVTSPGNINGGGTNDMVLTRVNTCPTDYIGSTVVTPASQMVCINGLVNQITMEKAVLSPTALPIVYLNGVATAQVDLPAKYQWQIANAAAGPWTNIPGAVGQNYVPASSATSKYYRRNVVVTCCETTTVHQTGDVAAVLVTTDIAPTVNAGGAMFTCPGTAITLGGTPTATPAPGSTIVSYLWTPVGTYSPSDTDPNPSVSPTASTIYGVSVTDDKGCKQLGQASVTVVTADAGPATISYCGTTPVRIGTEQTLAPGATYSWSSSPSGFSSTEAQPLVSPAVATTYTVTLTIPITGGGGATCMTTNSIVVTPVAAPTNNGGAFGGPDVTICQGATAVLGTSAESGFSYTWAPGNYLTNNQIAMPTFQPGSLILPVPDPFSYFVTALKSGCTFVDAVDAYVIKADAGIDGCGPRAVGTSDKTPGIAETYTWTKISGPGTFLGPTNQPLANVSASVGGPTTYELTVMVNGVSCTDQVIVPDCGCLQPTFTVNAPHSCPSFGLNGGVGTVSLTAASPLSYTYVWSPAAGLSTTTGPTVFLTDNIQRIYTVTATSTIDPTYVCTNTITVNNPAWALPVFMAQDVSTCPGTTIAIGQPPVAGYSYLWNTVPGISATTISDPTATTNSTTNYPVLVTDDLSGCTTRDTATVTIAGLPTNAAGTDFAICGAATGVQLGAAALPGDTYIWTSTPAGAVFMPNNMVANPTVDIAINTTYNVTVTNTATGCTLTDAISITVKTPVTPFVFTDATFCPSDAGAIALPAGPAGMTTYNWTPGAEVLNNTSNGPTATTTNPRPQTAVTYTLTVMNADGCSGFASTTLTPQPSLPNAGTDKSICLNEVSVSIGSASNPTGGGITYAWSPITGLSDATNPNPTFTPTVAGTTTFTLSKTESGCTTTDQVTVIVNDFTLPVMASPTVCQNGCVQIGTTPGAGTTFVWSPATGLSDANIANPIACPAATTVYNVTATGTNGCIATQPVIVNVNNSAAPTVTVPAVSACLGDDNVSFSPTVTPVGTYNYSWSPNDGTLSNVNIVNPQVNITAVGTKVYHITVTDPTSGCSNSATANLTVALCPPCDISAITATPGACVPATNLYTLTGAVTFANAPATGTMTVQITGGGSQVFNAPFTSPSNYSIAGQTSDGALHTVTATFSAAGACTNNIAYSAPANCMASCATITAPMGGGSSGTQSICEGSPGTSLSVSTSATSGTIKFVRFTSAQTDPAVIYAGGTQIGDVAPVAGVATLAYDWSAVAPGTYYVYAILNPDQGVACRPFLEIIVTIVDKPELSANDVTVCESSAGAGATVNLINLVQNPDGSTLTFSEGGNAIGTPGAANLALGMHTISVTGASSLMGCSTTVTFVVTVQAPSAPQSICPAQTFTLTAPPGLNNIKWFKDGVEVAQGNPYTVTMPGSYNYTADGAGGCSTGSCCPSVFVAAPCYDYGDAPNPYPSANHATVGAQLGLTRDSENAQQYSAGAIGDGADEDGVVRNSTKLHQCVTTTYTITVNGILPGQTWYLSGWIDFNDDGDWNDMSEQIATNVAVTANGPFNISVAVPCTATITAETYERFRLSTQTGLTPSTVDAPDGEIEDYAVEIGACAIVLNTTQTNVSCNSGANGTVNLTPSGGVEPYSYDWSNDGPENPDDDTADLTGLTAGTYTVTVTDADGCTQTTSVTITQPTAVTNVISNIVNANCAGGENGSATATASGGVSPYTFAWSYGFTQSGVTTSNATGLAAGGYNVTVTDANGCTTVTAFEIADPTGVTLVVTAITNETCDESNNGTAMVTASGGVAPYTFIWSGGTVVTTSPSSTASALAAGTYLVTATDANGCSAIQTIVISQPTNVVVEMIASLNESCPANNDGKLTASATGGMPGYTYLWSNGNTGNMGTNLMAGVTYVVTVTDQNGCTATTSGTITEPLLLTAAATVTSVHNGFSVSCNGGADGTAMVNTTGGTAPLTYLWSNGSADKTASGLTAGTYTVTVTDSHGCTATASVTLTQPTPMANVISNIVNANCAGGDNGSATATASGGVGPYTFAWSYGFTQSGVSTSNATGLAAGGYNVTVTDANGCTTVTAFEIADPTGVTLVVTTITNETCDESNNGTATVTASGGVAPYTFMWSGGTVVTTSPNSTASALAAGTYLVTATDANGCSAIQTIVITQPTNLVAQIIGHIDEGCPGRNDGAATVTATGGITNYTYNWSGGAAPTSATNTGLAAGTYTVTVTDANGCTATASVTIGTVPPMVLLPVAQNEKQCGHQDGSIDLTVSGGTPTYTYDWSNDGPDNPDNDTEDLTGLAAGVYTVTVTDSRGCTATTSVTITCTLPASIGNYTWIDTNANGVQDAGEPVLPGVTVVLTGTDGNGNAVNLTQVTNGSGLYLFSDLFPGTYKLTFVTPTGGYVVTGNDLGGNDATDSDANLAMGGMTVNEVMTPGENNLDYDAGYYIPASIGNFAWVDDNANGVQDPGEPGLEGVPVTLTGTDGQGNPLTLTTTTDVNGAYLFSNLVPGTYKLTFAVPVGSQYEITGNDLGGNDVLDSDANEAMGGMTANEVLTSGENNPNYDAGFYLPASLGDYVWLDENANGVQDAGEVGLAGVTVKLQNAAGNPVTVDADGVTIVNQVTNGVGFYQFTNLIPGTYKVMFVNPNPTKYTLTTANAGTDDAQDSDPTAAMLMTQTTVLGSGDNDPTLDAGFFAKSKVGDFVWTDTNGNGVQDAGEPGIGGVTVTLTGTDNQGNLVTLTTMTAGNGMYMFNDVVPGTYKVTFTTPTGGYVATPADQGGSDATDSDAGPMGMTPIFTVTSGDTLLTYDAGYYIPASIGNFTWIDSNADGDQDSGEAPLPGVVVVLTGTTGSGQSVNLTMLTDANGMYLFTGLQPGTYKLTFDTPIGGYVSTTPNDPQANDTNDSDADPAMGGMTVTEVLTSGENNLTYDAGYYQLASIGDFVWNDLDADGIQDSGEPGIVGATVTLTGTDGQGNPVTMTTTTDGLGNYLFSNLIPGTYKLTFGIPAGFNFTSPLDAGGNDAADSDANAAIGGMTVNEGLTSGEFNPTYDAGFYTCPVITIAGLPVQPICPGEDVDAIFISTTPGATTITWSGGAAIGLANGSAPGPNATIPAFIATSEATVTITVTAILGQCTITKTFTLTVSDVIPPVFDNCPTTMVMIGNDPDQCSGKLNWSIPTATDECAIFVAVTQTGGPASGSVISITCPPTPQTITYTANDSNGNTSTCTFQVMVIDTEKPEFDADIVMPGNITVECDAVPNNFVYHGLVLGPLTNNDVNDNCTASNQLVITFTETSTQCTNPAQCCYYSYTITRTWKVTDCAGNMLIHTQVITVQDTKAPTALCKNATIALDKTGILVLNPLLVDNGSFDNCAAFPYLTFSVAPNQFTCTNLGPNLVTLTVTDPCGNVGTCTATVTVTEGIAPCTPQMNVVTTCMGMGNATTLDNGQFMDLITVKSLAMQTWKLTANSSGNGQGLYSIASPAPPAAPVFLTIGTLFTAGTADGIDNDGDGQTDEADEMIYYTLKALHVEGKGYDITVSNVGGIGLGTAATTTQVQNKAYYPNPYFTNLLSDPFCLSTPPFAILVGEYNNAAGSVVPGSMMVDGVVTNIFNAAALGVGTHTVMATFDAGAATTNLIINGVQLGGTIAEAIADPGCQQKITQLVQIVATPNTLVCNDLVTVSMDADCKVTLTADDVLEGSYYCYDDYLVEVDKTLPMGNGPWVMAMFDASDIGKTYFYHVVHTSGGVNICWGQIKIEDKLAPALNCPADITIACSESTDVSHTGNVVVADCSAFTKVIDDEYTDFGQCSSPRGQIVRTWIVTDAWGNQASCSQIITIAPFDLEEVDFPDDVTVNCESAYLNPNATSPDVTGRPSINGFAIGAGGLCTASINYSDEIFDICPGSYEILRTWKVRNTCFAVSADNPIIHVQVITVADLGGPAFACPPAVTVSTDALTCCSTAALPDMIVTEGCSNIFNLEAKVTGTNPVNGNIITFTVGGHLEDFPGNNWWTPDTLAVFDYTQCVPLGTYNVRYKASDECGNISYCFFELTVADLVPPVAACDQTTTVAINGNDPYDCYTPADGCDGAGVTWVKAKTFDDGSYDNCNQLKFTVRRMAPYSACINALSHDPCYPGNVSEFDLATAELDSIKFYCCEVGQTQTVILRVYQIDVNGNYVLGLDGEPIYNECMIQVEVQDKIKPICQPPANVTVACENFDPSLWLYGKAEVLDNCCLDKTKEYQGQCGLAHSVSYTLFDTVCNRGTIVRTFRAYDCHGLSSQCTQRVVVNYNQKYYIKFPNDTIVTACNAGFNYTEPKFYGEDCELLGVSYEDQVFTVVPDACFKIERNWKIINWCTFNPDGLCINVPNPNPNAISNHPTNLPGPVVSDINPVTNPTNPWRATRVKVTSNPLDTFTNYATQFYNKEANCYTYKQVIKIIDTQDPEVTCPASPVTICDVTANDGTLWNESYWWDNANQSHDLCEAPSDICITATDLCSGANINIEYQLFLDLDGDGVMETVVNSTQLGGQSGGLGWNNILFGNVTGVGQPRQFDGRPVPTNQKWGFALEEKVDVATKTKTACVKFNTFQTQEVPNQVNAPVYVTPQLPHGTHKIKWFVTDGCGNETICEYTIIIKDCKAPTVVCLDGLSVNIMPGGMIQMWASDFLQYTEDNCTLTPWIKIGIRKCGTGTGFPYDNNGNPITNVLFDCTELGPQCVELWAIDLAGNADFCATTLDVQDNNGNCGTPGMVNVSGALKTEMSDGVEEATVSITGSDDLGTPLTFSGVSNGQGLYWVNGSIPLASDITITPAKDDNPLNGVTTYDLVLISKHILGIEPLGSPYKMIAADANKSSSITTFDIVELRKLILGIYQELPNNTSWRFVDKAYTFPNVQNPFMGVFPENISIAEALTHQFGQDFVGVKIGDVNNTVVSNSLMMSDDRSAGTLLFDVEDRDVKAGEVFEVTFKAGDKTQGYQMTLNLNGLAVSDLSQGDKVGSDKVSESNFGVFNDALTVSINESDAFTVKFRATKSGKLSTMLSVSSRITKAEGYTMQHERLDVGLRFSSPTGTTISGVGFELYQNQPNPFVNKTMIGFHLPEATAATLTVFDESGRMVFSQKGDFAKGYNVFSMERQLIGTTGALWYRVETSTDSATRTMIQTK